MGRWPWWRGGQGGHGGRVAMVARWPRGPGWSWPVTVTVAPHSPHQGQGRPSTCASCQPSSPNNSVAESCVTFQIEKSKSESFQLCSARLGWAEVFVHAHRWNKQCLEIFAARYFVSMQLFASPTHMKANCPLINGNNQLCLHLHIHIHMDQSEKCS